MQDFALAGKQIVIHIESIHGAQMAAKNRRRDDIRNFGDFACTFLDIFQSLRAEREARFIFLEILGDAGVQVPAEIIEARLRCESAYIGEGVFFKVNEAEYNVGDLDAGVIDVVLDFDATAGVAEEARKRIADHGVAQMTDVRGLVGIDGRVLDDGFGTVWGGGDRFLSGLRNSLAKKCGAIEKCVEVAATCDFEPIDAGNGAERGRDFLSELARGALESLGEFETDGGRDLSHFNFGWTRGDNREFRAVFAADEGSEGLAEVSVNLLIHRSSASWRQNLKWRF